MQLCIDQCRQYWISKCFIIEANLKQGVMLNLQNKVFKKKYGPKIGNFVTKFTWDQSPDTQVNGHANLLQILFNFGLCLSGHSLASTSCLVWILKQPTTRDCSPFSQDFEHCNRIILFFHVQCYHTKKINEKRYAV